jgi:hypothetical protein
MQMMGALARLVADTRKKNDRKLGVNSHLSPVVSSLSNVCVFFFPQTTSKYIPLVSGFSKKKKQRCGVRHSKENDISNKKGDITRRLSSSPQNHLIIFVLYFFFYYLDFAFFAAAGSMCTTTSHYVFTLPYLSLSLL